MVGLDNAGKTATVRGIQGGKDVSLLMFMHAGMLDFGSWLCEKMDKQ